MTQHEEEIAEAMATLKAAMADEPYAWQWHCNVAMAAINEGTSEEEANQAAARFMHDTFGVDTLRLWHNYQSVVKERR